jgi:hypothetical protein
MKSRTKRRGLNYLLCKILRLKWKKSWEKKLGKKGGVGYILQHKNVKLLFLGWVDPLLRSRR